MLNICAYQVTGTSILASNKITSFTDQREVVRNKSDDADDKESVK